MPMTRTLAVLVLAAVPATSALGTRQPTTRVLDRPQVEVPEPFTVIGSVRELSDGRVIVVDNGDRVVYVADFSARSASQIGRQGSGPAEYRIPGTLLPLAGDTTLLTDAGNRRLLALGPDAQPVAILGDAWPMPTGEPGTRLPRAVDSRGRGYLQGRAAHMSASGAVIQLDSAPLLRTARGSATDETVGYVHLAPRRVNTTTKNGVLTSVEVLTPPYSAQDGWQAFADGAVAIVRVRDYRVDWLLPDGRRVAGPAIAYSPIRIGQRDKDEWPPNSARARGAPTGSPALSAPPRPVLDWPEFKPPFPSGGVLASSDGRVWVQRHTVAGDTRTRYDVIDRRGAVVQRVEVPAGGRVVGFGPRSIYVARKDADDLQYLQRFGL